MWPLGPEAAPAAPVLDSACPLARAFSLLRSAFRRTPPVPNGLRWLPPPPAHTLSPPSLPALALEKHRSLQCAPRWHRHRGPGGPEPDALPASFTVPRRPRATLRRAGSTAELLAPLPQVSKLRHGTGRSAEPLGR